MQRWESCARLSNMDCRKKINTQIQEHTEEPLLVNKVTFQLQMHKHKPLNVQVVGLMQLMSLMINANGKET